MRRSPFGVLDDSQWKRQSAVDSTHNSFATATERPVSAGGLARRAIAVDEAVHIDEPSRKFCRPKSANSAIRSILREPLRQQNTVQPDRLTQEQIDCIDDMMHCDDEGCCVQDPAQRNARQTSGKSRSLRKDESKKDKKVTIHSIELSEKDWGRILSKYQINDLNALRFNFLRKGKGSTTKLDHIAKSVATAQAQRAGTEAQDDPLPREQQLLQDHRRKEKERESHFAAQLQDQQLRELEHLHACIDECNHFCTFLQLPQRFLYRDGRSVRKFVDVTRLSAPGAPASNDFESRWKEIAKSITKRERTHGIDATEQSTPLLRILPVDRFHREHAQLLNDFHVFSKRHPEQSLDAHAAPISSAHFIGVEELLFSGSKQVDPATTAAETVEPNRSHKFGNSAPGVEPEPAVAPVAVGIGDVQRRQAIIATQQRILQHFDDLQLLLEQQLQTIKDKGWNSSAPLLLSLAQK